MYLYETHLGWLRLSEERIPPEYLHFEEGGPSDRELGRVETFEDVLNLVTDEDGKIPWSNKLLESIRLELEDAMRKY